MVGPLEFICFAGELTIDPDPRHEGTADIYAVTRLRGNRPPQHHELKYDTSAQAFMTDLKEWVGGDALPPQVSEREGCATYAELFSKRFTQHFYPAVERRFELLLGGFDVHSMTPRGDAFTIDVTYHNSHGPGERHALHLNGNPTEFVQQIFAIAGSPLVPEEMQSEAYHRIRSMYYVLHDMPQEAQR